jgi:protein-export membrane protein SecD/preprotein translocase SecF subunit
MWDFVRRWHPIILLLVGIYLAIPKPAPAKAEIDEEFLKENDTNGDGWVDREEWKGLDFDLRDLDKDGKLGTGSRFRWPLHDYKMNLGQDLKGGSSLRYVLQQQDLADSEAQIRELLSVLRDHREKLSAEGRNKFASQIDGQPPVVNGWADDDFALLVVAGVFDEGRADAVKRYYKSWNDAAKRRDDKDLVGPTIETLNRRLNSTGITELNITPLGDNRIEVRLPEFASSSDTDRYKLLLQSTGKLEMRVLAPESGDFANLQVNQYPKDEGYRYKWLELARDDVSSSLVKELAGKKYVPVQVIDDYEVSGKDISDIQPSTDQQGRMAVSFSLKGLAVARFENLTRKHRKAASGGEDPRLLAIIIDGKVYSAYSIEDTISGSVQLSGNFNTKERDDIINVLKSGSLNVKLALEGEESVGPSEGAEAVQRGLYSFIIAAVFVFAFAVWLYRGLGFLVIFNLLLIIVLIMGGMAAGLGTLTLPGIAGLVLTFGMAIDGNILINERMREELAKGLAPRSAAEEGFKNAFSAIVDSNITTLLTALILFKVGSGPVQGFALTVAMGIVATLYANIPAYKAMVMGVLSIKRDTKFKMQSLKWLENRNIDFVKGMKIAVPVGILVTIAGVLLLFSLGRTVLGMEFRGGYAFRIQMNQGYERDDIAGLLVDEHTGDPKFEWAEGVEVQPVYRFQGGSGTGADRFDFRFPMQDAWEFEDPEKITAMLRAELETVLSDRMVVEGWELRPTEVREVALEARLTLRLKDAEKFRTDNPEAFEELWLLRDRAFAGAIDTPSNKKDEWFRDIGAAVVDTTWNFNAARDRQIYTLKLTGVTVADAQDRERKLAAFKAAIAKNIVDDSRTIELDAEGNFTEAPTKAKLLIKLAFLEPVETAVLETYLTDQLPGTLDAGLGGMMFTVNAVNPDADKAKQFELTTTETTFGSDPIDPTSLLSIDHTLNEKIGAWVASNTEGNEISKRYLLSSAVGAAVASEMQWRALLAIAAALVILVIYMRIRFASLAWGVAAIIAIGFCVTVTMSLFALADAMGAGFKIDLVIVAAILTLVGYAINDVIVNFDRIREVLKKDRLATGGKTPLREIINISANAMLPRTLMTGGTTLTSTAIMMFFGGPLLQAFSFTIFFGVIVGTFGSVFIASPVLLLFDRRGEGALLDLTEEEEAELSGESKDKEAAEAEAAEPDEADFRDDTEGKPEAKAETKADVKEEAKAEPKPESKDEPKKD